jgi:plastocyanin
MDSLLVPVAGYFDPETVTVQAGSVVTYNAQTCAVNHILA